MNGRVYDPVVGRFISANPVIDWGLGTQATNRYGYVGGNPLTWMDPTGFDCQDNPEDGNLTGCDLPPLDITNTPLPYDECDWGGPWMAGCTLYNWLIRQGRRFEFEPYDDGGSGAGDSPVPSPEPTQNSDPEPPKEKRLDACQATPMSSPGERLEHGPDFWTVSLPVIGPFVGISITVDRYDQVFVGPSVGLSFPPVSVTTGIVSDSPRLLTRDGYSGGDVWSQIPSASELRNFLSGIGGNIGVGPGVGVNVSENPSHHRIAAQLMTPSASASYEFTLRTVTCP